MSLFRIDSIAGDGKEAPGAPTTWVQVHEPMIFESAVRLLNSIVVMQQGDDDKAGALLAALPVLPPEPKDLVDPLGMGTINLAALELESVDADKPLQSAQQTAAAKRFAAISGSSRLMAKMAAAAAGAARGGAGKDGAATGKRVTDLALEAIHVNKVSAWRKGDGVPCLLCS